MKRLKLLRIKINFHAIQYRTLFCYTFLKVYIEVYFAIFLKLSIYLSVLATSTFDELKAENNFALLRCYRYSLKKKVTAHWQKWAIYTLKKQCPFFCCPKRKKMPFSCPFCEADGICTVLFKIEIVR